MVDKYKLVNEFSVKPKPSGSIINFDDDSLIKTCKECGGAMVIRTAKHGPKKGSKFWGCSNFPKCKGLESIKQ